MKRLFLSMLSALALMVIGLHSVALATSTTGNLLENSRFEMGLGGHGWPVGWQGIGGVQYGSDVTLIEDPTSGGEFMLAIHHPMGRDTVAVISDPIPAKPGEIFKVTGRMRNSEGKKVGIYLIFLDANRREIAQRGATSESKSWVLLDTQRRIAPPGTAYVRAMIWQGNSLQSSGTLEGTTTFVDDVNLIREVPKIVDVSIDEIPRVPPQVQSGEHPRLYMTQAEIDAIQQIGRQNPATRILVNNIVNLPARRILWKYEGEDIVLPPKPPNNQGEVILRSTDPIHREYASDAVTVAIGYAFTGNEDMGNTAKEILLKYAHEYTNYSHRAVREGRLTSETREEALWLIDMAWAYDLIAGGDLLSAPEKNKIEAMLREAAGIIDRHRMVRNDINWQATHNSALAAVAFLLEDEQLIERVLVGPKSFTELVPQMVRQDGMAMSQSISHHWYDIGRWFLVGEPAYRSGYDIYNYTFAGNTLKDMVDLPFNYVFIHGEHPLIGHANYGTRLLFRWQVAVAYERYGDPKYLWLWRRDGLVNLAIQGDNQRTLPFLPSLLKAPASGEPRYAISFGDIGQAGRNMSGSTLLADSGFAMLRGATDDGIALEAVMLFKPHGTVNGHQGYDNLTMMLAGKESVWIPGTGSHSYAMDYPEQRGWYEQTVARSGVVVDEKPQYPLSDYDTRYAIDSGRSSAGKLTTFIALPSVSMAKAETDTVYAGVAMERTLLLSAPYMIDRYRVGSDEEHQYDWVVHVRGEEGDINVEQRPLTGTLGDANGYHYIKDVRSATSDDGWVARWTKSGEHMQLIMLGGEMTEIIRAEGLGVPVTPQPLVMARRHTEGTEYIALYELYKHSPSVVGMSAVESDDYKGVRIERKDGLFDHWLWRTDHDAAGTPVAVDGNLAFSGREAFFRSSNESRIQSALVVEGTVLQTQGITLRSSIAADIALESLDHGIFVMSQASRQVGDVTLEILCDCEEETFRLFTLAADVSEGGKPMAREVVGLAQSRTAGRVSLQWTAQPNEVYVIAPQQPNGEWLDRFAIEITL